MKKRDGIKIAVVSIVSVLLVALIGSAILLQFLIPKDSTTEGFFATFQGTITSNTTNKAGFVHVYHSSPLYEGTRLGYSAQNIAVSNLHWTGNTTQYTISVWLPAEMEVIVTSEPTGCYHEKTFVSRKNSIQTINLINTDEQCYSPETLPDDYNTLIQRTRDSLDSLSRDLSKVQRATPLKEMAGADIEDSWDELGEVSRASNQTEKELHALRAYFLRQRALLNVRLIGLEDCANKTLPLITTNDTCKITPYPEKMTIYEANQTLETARDSWLQGRTVVTQEKEGLVRDVQGIQGYLNQINNEQSACEEAQRTISRSLEDQETVCKARRYTLTAFDGSYIALLIMIGVVIGIYACTAARRWIEK